MLRNGLGETGRKQLLGEGLGQALERDADRVEANILRGSDVDAARDGVEGGVGLIGGVVVDDDLHARVGTTLGHLHDEARNGAGD